MERVGAPGRLRLASEEFGKLGHAYPVSSGPLQGSARVDQHTHIPVEQRGQDVPGSQPMQAGSGVAPWLQSVQTWLNSAVSCSVRSEMPAFAKSSLTYSRNLRDNNWNGELFTMLPRCCGPLSY